MSDTVQQIKDRLTIVDVVSQYVKLERAGLNMRARCPFHAEKTPSFIVSPDRGTYHCFGCSVGGDIFSFVQGVEGVDFKGALKILAEKAGVPLVFSGSEKKEDTDRLFEVMEAATIFYQNKLTSDAREYLRKRGASDETIHVFRIGYAGDAWSELTEHLKQKKFSEKEIVDAGLAKKGDKGLTDKFRNRIMFPLADTAGRVVAFSGRTFGEHAHPDAPKYLNSPETALYHKSRILYGFDRAKHSIRKHTCAILVEGQMDLVLSHQAGWGNTVAVSGTAFTNDHAKLLLRMSENLLIALDADEAGFKAASRAAHAALQMGMQVKVAQLPPGLDPADLISKEGPEAWRSAIRGAKDIITFLLDVLQEKSKDSSQLRRSIESIVLPFLLDVQSPIAKEQYEKEIADRLGVSVQAIRGAESKLPKPPPPPLPKETIRPADAPNRIKQAYGLLLWQLSLKTPAFDTDWFEKELESAVGKETMDALRTMPLDDKETLRFFAEQLHMKNGTIKRTAEALLHVLRREHLQVALTGLTEAMREAEEKGDEEQVSRIAEEVRVLTGQIAKIAE